MALRDDLVAARALIDTQEKFDAYPEGERIVAAADRAAEADGDRFAAIVCALFKHCPVETGYRRVPKAHDDIMALFDAALSEISP